MRYGLALDLKKRPRSSLPNMSSSTKPFGPTLLQSITEAGIVEVQIYRIENRDKNGN